jgi:predicted RNA-binding Zn-ribbon protein involved in translation (DUF1610 family)
MKTILIILGILAILLFVALFLWVEYLIIVIMMPKIYCRCGEEMTIDYIEPFTGKVTYKCPRCGKTQIINNEV